MQTEVHSTFSFLYTEMSRMSPEVKVRKLVQQPMNVEDEAVIPNEAYLCVWCDGVMPMSPDHVKGPRCTCILCDMCRERILINNRTIGSRKCRRCEFGFAN